MLASSPSVSMPTFTFTFILFLMLYFFLLQKHLIEFCYTVAQKYLLEGKHEDAVPAALHSLRFRMARHGLSSVELVPAYLLLAEASLGEWTRLTLEPLRSTVLDLTNNQSV